MAPELMLLELGAIPAMPFSSWGSLAESLCLSVPQLSHIIGTKEGRRREVKPFVPPSLIRRTD